MSLESPPNPSTTPSVSPNQASQPVMVRVLMVDDHLLVRQGLRVILAQFDHIQVVGEAATGQEAVALTQTLAPDVVLMDVNMPIKDGIQATRQIAAHFPQVVVIGLSVHKAPEMAAAMKQAGAAAYVTKDAAPEQLYQTICEALNERRSRSDPTPR